MEIKTILIVDDEESLGRALYRGVSRMLRDIPAERAGDAAVHYIHGDGRQVLKLLEDQPRLAEGKILLITDGNMPGMNGAQLIDELQKRLGSRLTALLMSGNVHEFQNASQRLGFLLLGKPITADHLRPFVRTFLDLPESPT